MKAKRLIELMMRVNTKQKFTVQELADEFGVSYRTMWRDLQELSALGVPLYSDPGPGGGYQVLREQPLPKIQPKERPVGGTLVQLPTIHIVGTEVTCPYTAFDEAGILIPRLWLKIISRKSEVPNLVDGKTRISASDNRADEFQIWFGFEVTQVGDVPEGMVSKTVPPQHYVRFTHYGALERSGVHATYYSAYGWLGKHGYSRVKGGLVLERFDERFRPESPECAYDIFMPVEQKETPASHR